MYIKAENTQISKKLPPKRENRCYLHNIFIYTDHRLIILYFSTSVRKGNYIINVTDSIQIITDKIL